MSGIHFGALLFVSLIAGAVCLPQLLAAVNDGLENAFKNEFPRQATALKLDAVSLPDFELVIAGENEEFPKRTVSLTGGKVLGLVESVKPRSKCGIAVTGEVSCHLYLDGPRITYQASATNPKRDFTLEARITHSTLEFTVGAGTDDKAELKNFSAPKLHLWVSQPREFSADPAQNVVFENELKTHLLGALESTVAVPLREALSKTISSIALYRGA